VGEQRRRLAVQRRRAERTRQSTPPPVSQPAPAPVAALAPAPVSDQVDAGRVEPETKRGPFARAFAKLFGWFGRRPSHEPA
jgi:hypothetical protein